MNNINYTPFLKLKDNEIAALKALYPPFRELITPFFDFPPKQDSKKIADFAEQCIKNAKKIAKNLGIGQTLYLDTYDIEDHIVAGVNGYLYLLNEFAAFDVIPVTGMDRSPEHQQSINDFVSAKKDANAIIAYRVTPQDFVSFDAIEDEIADSLDGLIYDLFTQVDLIMDCRITLNLDHNQVTETAQSIINFTSKFTAKYPVRKVIVTGSTIPISLVDIVATNQYASIDRNEMAIHQIVKLAFSEWHNIEFGDYTTVSPEFGDPNKMAAMNAASKLIYADANKHHIWRGERLRGPPSKAYLYNGHIRAMMSMNSPTIYRGQDFSWADNDFYQKQNDTGGYWSSSIIRYIINAHISYMSQTYSC